MKSPGLWLGGMVAVVALGFAALVNLGGAASATVTANGDKFLVCHKDGDKFMTLELSESGVQNHLDTHEDDYAGPCEDETSTATSTSTSTSTATATATETATSTPGPTVTVLIPGPGATSVVTSTATITATPAATAAATITPAPGTVTEPAIPPAAGTVAEGQEVTPMPATVPAGGGSEGSSGLPMTALLLMVGSVLAAIGASVKLARGNR